MTSYVIVYQYRNERNDVEKKSGNDETNSKSPIVFLTPVYHSLNDVSETVLRNQLTRRLMNGASMECGTICSIQLPSDEGETGFYSIVLNIENSDIHYILCVLHNKKDILEAYISELDNFSLTVVKPTLSTSCKEDEVKRLMESWSEHTIEPLKKGILLLQDVLADVLAVACINGKLDRSELSGDTAAYVDVVFSIASVFRRQDDVKKPPEKVFGLRPSPCNDQRLEMTKRPLDGEVAFFRTIAADAVEAAEAGDVTRLKTLFQNFHVKVAHDTNTVKRLVDQARDSYYALYRLLLVTEADREPRLSLLQCFIHMPDAFNEEERAIIRLVRDFARENKPESLCI